MNKGVVIGIIIVIIIIGTISAYSVIDQNSNTDEIIPSDAVPEKTGTNHSIELSEGLTMTSPSP
jgi:ATP/ADP translocase